MMRPRVIVLAFLIVTMAGPSGIQAQQPAPWRPTVMTMNGMVAAGHPMTAEVGLRVLQQGGNAIDAAIAAWFTQGQVEPGSTGLGGDMFILFYDAKTKEVRFINGSGPAPMAATADFYRSKGGMPREGPLSVEVPGAVGSAVLAAETYGTMPLNEILEPAIEIAEQGFPITNRLASSLEGAKEKLGKFSSTRKIWFKGDRPFRVGEVLVNKDLAQTLRSIASQGAEAFYRGEIAQMSLDYLKANGGIHELSDWAAYHAHEDTPIVTTYRGIEVYECPPNSQGHVMLQAMNILEGFDLRYMGHNSAPYLHVVTEALKLSFADRNRYNGDPRVVPTIPMAELLSKEYAAVRRALIEPDRAFEGEPAPGDPRQLVASESALAYASPQPVPDTVNPWNEDEVLNLTTYLNVVDKDRNMVSITSSLLSGFGSGMVVEGAGYLLNNRMAYFWLDPENVNVLEPGKRVRQTINPALALKDGKPYMVFGTPGADTQPQTQLQFFLNVVEFGMGVQQALEQPAVISRSFEPSYYPHEVEGTLLTPTALPEHVQQSLAALGHKLDLRPSRGVGSNKAVVVHPETNVLMGGVSPTGDSYVMGW